MSQKQRPKTARSGDEDAQGLTLISLLLPGIVGAMKIAPPPPEPKPPTVQGKYHYTTAQQINDLLEVREGSPEMGFMTRIITLCSLPRIDPGTRLQYKRETGPFKLVMIAGGDNKLPYGNLPRLLLAWVCTEVVQTKNRDLQLGHSLAAFMRQLGMNSDSGGSRADRTRLRQQIDRLFNAHIQLIYEAPGRKSTISSTVADRTDLWWDYKAPTQDTLWQSSIRLGEALFEEILKHPVPIDMRILKAMRRSSLGLDLYLWLSYKTFTLYSQNKKPERLSWHLLYRQFGSDPAKASDKITVQAFRKDVMRELKKLKLSWPTLDYAIPKGFLEVRACMPSIQPQALPLKATGSP
jgi:hypothetical protein